MWNAFLIMKMLKARTMAKTFLINLFQIQHSFRCVPFKKSIQMKMLVVRWILSHQKCMIKQRKYESLKKAQNDKIKKVAGLV
jgi:hypothetical protein